MSMDENASRYPLSWPAGWKRTPPIQRRAARFSVRVDAGSAGSSYKRKQALTVYVATDRLEDEINKLGAKDVVLSTNIELKLNGQPRSGRRDPDDPGVAVYFRLRGKPRCLACDRWTTVADNIAAIAAHIDAIRAVDRYGVGTMDQAFAGYAALPESTVNWRVVLGMADMSMITVDMIQARYRELAKTAHPDRGGSAEEFRRIEEARSEGVKELLQMGKHS